MTRERAKELLPLITAFAEGAEIQCRRQGTDNQWFTCHPAWVEDQEYRVKPELMECWGNVYSNHGPCYYPTKDAADSGAGTYRVSCVHMREVEEDTP